MTFSPAITAANPRRRPCRASSPRRTPFRAVPNGSAAAANGQTHDEEWKTCSWNAAVTTNVPKERATSSQPTRCGHPADDDVPAADLMDGCPLLEREGEAGCEHGPERPELGQRCEVRESQVALADDQCRSARDASEQCCNDKQSGSGPSGYLRAGHWSNDPAASRKASTTTVGRSRQARCSTAAGAAGH